MTDIFNMREASIFARALAGGEGISVEESSAAITPVSRKDGTIIMGEPSIYDADEYMGNLHKEISKQMEGMKFFFDIEEGDGFTDAASSILQDVRVEFHKHGEYQGRDSILAKHYANNCQKNGGISEVIKTIEKSSPTLAAMVAIGNDLRNDWQGYQYAEVSPVVQKEIDRLSFLKDEWLELDSKESLETLIKRIRNDEPGQGSSGEDQRTDDEEESGDDKGGSGTEGNNSESKGESGTDGNNSESKGESGTDEGGESGAEGSVQGRDERGDADRGSGTSSGDEGTNGGDGDPGQDSSGTGGGADEEESEAEWGGYGATEAFISLEEMGFLKKPIKDNALPPRSEGVLYVSQGDKDLQEKVIEENLRYKNDLYPKIENEIGSFTLSKKMKKYFIAQKQSGYQYGLKRGKLCSKNMYRVSVGGTEPAIFKKKNASKIEQDIAIFILGDCSASMCGDPYVTSAACQISMSEVLQSMRIPHMMMQFSTMAYIRSHYIMRSFSEKRVSREVLLSRYSSSDIWMGCNADGEAVIAASQYLIKMPQRKKLIIVLSDGAPMFKAGSGKFLKDVVEKIEDSKCIDIVGVGIDTEVSRYYSNSKKVTELKDLENVLLSILKDTIIRG